MTVIKKKLSLDEFLIQYEDERFEYLDGQAIEIDAASTDHGYIQLSIGGELRQLFRKKGPKSPDGWWMIAKAPVRYGSRYLFYHDLAGWKQSTSPQRPRDYPVSQRPDRVCEILFQNRKHDEIVKKHILHTQKLPYYWIVDPTNEVIVVFEWQEKEYQLLLEIDVSYKGIIPPFWGKEIDLKSLFGED
jgi:Uma2 family endonuclease